MKTIFIKPTNRCNLNCDYCYNSTASRNRDLAPADLELLFNRIAGSFPCHEEIQIIWHGGEPLLVGSEFYRAVDSFSRTIFTRHKVSHNLQTNGTLLTDKIIEQLVAWNIDIGLSIDGFDYESNTHRHLTEEMLWHILKKAEQIKRRQGRLGFVVVLTRANILKLKEIISFAAELGGDLKLNQVMEIGNKDYSLTADDATHLISAYDYYTQQYNHFGIMVEPFFSMTKTFFSGVGHSCHFGESCAENFLSVSPDGSMYPCARFEDERFHLGNIFEQDLTVALNNSKKMGLTARNRKKDKDCGQCRFFSYCHGGCPHSAYRNRGSYFSADPFCFLIKPLYSHIFSRICENESLSLQTMEPIRLSQ